MPKLFRTFWCARRGSNSAEYEDAFAANEVAGRFAVADGATEGCFTGLWARLLVEDFVSSSGEGTAEWPDFLPTLQERWDTDVCARNLPWYAEQGVRHGAFATFLGLVLTASPRPLAEEGPLEHSPRPLAGDGPLEHSPLPLGEGPGVRVSFHWQAVAVGDTCLLHTREDALLRVFPIDRAEQFDNFPKLVGSRMSVEDIRARQSLWIDGNGQCGDRLWMMTDALAQWCLTEIEAGRNPWNNFESLLSDIILPSSTCGRGAGGEGDLFVSLIEELRDTGRLRNDDVTLLAIQL